MILAIINVTKCYSQNRFQFNYNLAGSSFSLLNQHSVQDVFLALLLGFKNDEFSYLLIS